MSRPNAVLWQDALVAGGGAPVPVRIYQPANAGSGTVVWAHGGSWTGGSVAAWHGLCEDLARLSGRRTISVEYRLAPGDRHPAPVEDVLAVLAWEANRPRTAMPLVVGGDSAGGTIAAGAALAARDQGVPLAGQILAYPPLDPACIAAAYHCTSARFPTAAGLRAAWRQYAGPATDRAAAPLVPLTPLDATDLRGLPPTVIAVGDQDPCRDDAARYATALEAVGGKVKLRIFPGVGHGELLQTRPAVPTGTPMRRWLAGQASRLLSDSPNPSRPAESV